MFDGVTATVVGPRLIVRGPECPAQVVAADWNRDGIQLRVVVPNLVRWDDADIEQPDWARDKEDDVLIKCGEGGYVQPGYYAGDPRAGVRWEAVLTFHVH